MSFDRRTLINACELHGMVARVVVASVAGSAPRETGAAMLVWKNGQSGTIGGGSLEFEAAHTARSMLPVGGRKLTRHALGPDLGQCCGGAVQLLTEVYDIDMAAELPHDIIARGKGAPSLTVSRLISDARSKGTRPLAGLTDGWMIEQVTLPSRDIWIWGAGHVGRALTEVLAPLPTTRITWIDTHARRFPDKLPVSVQTVPAADPAIIAPHAPDDAEHLIVTFSHSLDLELCHSLLTRGFRYAGLIGSATKWARFRKRLAALGHSQSAISQITCPIGRPELGKDPHTIAIGVAAEMLQPASSETRMEHRA